MNNTIFYETIGISHSLLVREKVWGATSTADLVRFTGGILRMPRETGLGLRFLSGDSELRQPEEAQRQRRDLKISLSQKSQIDQNSRGDCHHFCKRL
jgi:hypothetical protein